MLIKDFEKAQRSIINQINAISRRLEQSALKEGKIETPEQYYQNIDCMDIYEQSVAPLKDALKALHLSHYNSRLT